MIKYLVMDVDGSLTDGKIYMGNFGESVKAFSIKDGYAINHIIRPAGIEPVIITGRTSQIVEKRCEELGISKIYQGKIDKLSVLLDLVGSENLDECAYFGDDIIDLTCMFAIKEAGGFVGCPADAVKEVKAIAHYICENNAGQGAMREFSEWLIKPKINNKIIQNRVNEAIEYISKLDVSFLSLGKYVVNDNFFYVVQEYMSKGIDDIFLKSHKKYIDIQWIVEGNEVIQIANISSLTVKEKYNAEKDIILWNLPTQMIQMNLNEEGYVVLYPEYAYKNCSFMNMSKNIKKIVGKVKIF